MKKILFTFFALFLLGFAACKKDEAAPLKAFEDITFEDIKNHQSEMSYQEIVVRKDHQVKSGTVLTFNNLDYFLGKMKIISIDQDYTLTFDLVVYNSNGSVKWNKQGITAENTSNFDFNTGIAGANPGIEDFYFTSINDDFDMSIFPYPATYFYIYSK